MLANKKTRIIIGAVIALCVLIASSIWVISSMKSNSVDDFEYNNLADSSASVTSVTQIDRIIQNSNNTEDGNDNMYHVYIIYPGSSADAAVETLFKSGTFKQYVINGYRTIDDMMADDKIDVQTFQVGTLNAMGAEDLATTLGKADLIYLYSSSDANVAYTGANAISENLYEVLHNYAFGSNKPLLINYHMQNNGDTPDIVPASEVGNTQLYAMTTSDFKNSWRTARTYNVSSWKAGFSGADLCKNDGTGILPDFVESIRSGYKAYSVDENKDWNSYWRRTGTTDAMLNILYVTADDRVSNDDLNGMARFALWMVGDGSDKVFTGNTDNRPKRGSVEGISAKDLTVDKLYVDAEHTIKRYDYIFIAPSTAYRLSNDISTEVRAELNSLSNDKNGLTYIVFGTLEDGNNQGGSSSGKEDLTIDTSTNFGKLVDLSVTTNGYAKKSNVLVIGTKFLQTIQSDSEKNPTKIGQLATLLNKSTFRKWSGNGGGGNSGSISTTAFRVLELQPCYPIDLDVAYSNPISTGGNQYASRGLRKGNYYTIPSNVVDGVTEDDIVAGTEYYQWDLSTAKLAYALNLPADQIELVQMSTAEFVSSKADVTDSYDLIYIGGNMSAMKPTSWYGYVTDRSSPSYNSDYAFYAMYTHMAEVINISMQGTGAHGNLAVAGSKQYRFTQLNGNDLTTDRYNQLVEYADSGMPIVIGDELWDRYEAAEKMNNKLANRYLDVDSNMYALLSHLSKNQTGNKTNQLLGWENKVPRTTATSLWKAGVSDATKDDYLKDYYVSVRQEDLNDQSNTAYQSMKIENPDGKYGTSDSVTVWAETLNTQLYNLVMAKSVVRPKFSIDTNAVAYVSNDNSTKIQKSSLTDPSGKLYWNVSLDTSIAGHTYTAYLLEDKDDNAEFSLKSEQVMKVDLVDGKGTLTYTVPSTFWGAISWKILVVDTTNSANTDEAPANGTAAISMIARAVDDEKKNATMLEIMPISLADNGHYYSEHHDYAAQDGHTLYLDANYQQGTGMDFLYSSLDDTDYYTKNHKITENLTYQYSKKVGTGGYAFITNSGNGAFWKNTNIFSAKYLNGSNNSEDCYVGKYQARLSIDRYDSVNDREDWTYNYIDEISDDYDLTLDIMYLDDIEYYSYMANTLTDEQREVYQKKMAESYNEYMSYVEPNYGGKHPDQSTDPYYVREKVESELRNVIQGCLNGESWFGKSLKEDEVAALETALHSGDYFKIFYSETIRNLAVYNKNEVAAKKIINAYQAYVAINDKKIDAYRAYRHYSLLSYGPEEFLRKNYDIICFGFYDDMKYGFDFSQNACDAFMSFLEPKDDSELLPGAMLITHDNMAKVDEDSYSQVFTNNLRSYIGMDRFHFTADAATTDSFVPKYTAGNTSSASKYFVTTVSINEDFGRSSTLSGAEWAQASQRFVDAMHNGNSFIDKLVGYDNAGKGSAKIGYPGLTNAAAIVRTGASLNPQYTYEEYEVTTQMNWNLDQNGPLKVAGTTKATQVNRGVVTTYPFYIPSDIRVSPTHNQAYALDLEDDQVTAWYTLAADNQSVGGSSTDYAGMKSNSSTYAAAPKDATNNYYIYSKGNVTYCGAGHAAITGEKRDNNDERRLFINVLVNMANKSQRIIPEEPDITLYDPDGTTKAPGNVVKYDETTKEYYISVNSRTSYPEFGFEVSQNYMEDITGVQIFYDLDYGLGETGEKNDLFTQGVDQMVLDMTYPKGNNLTADQEVAKKLIDNLRAGKVQIIDQVNFPALSTQLKLAEDGKTYIDYFAPYNNKYTYLVIRVTAMRDGVETVLTKRIRVNLNRDLLDLT